jgi:hypothetical protein
VGGASGRVREHWGIEAELVDVQAAPDDGRSRLSMWRPSVAAAQRGTGVGSDVCRPLASGDESGRSPVLTRGPRLWSAGSGSESADHRRRVWQTRWQLFLGAAATRGLEAGPCRRRRRRPWSGCSTLERGGLTHRWWPRQAERGTL